MSCDARQVLREMGDGGLEFRLTRWRDSEMGQIDTNESDTNDWTQDFFGLNVQQWEMQDVDTYERGHLARGEIRMSIFDQVARAERGTAPQRRESKPPPRRQAPQQKINFYSLYSFFRNKAVLEQCHHRKPHINRERPATQPRSSHAQAQQKRSSTHRSRCIGNYQKRPCICHIPVSTSLSHL